MEERGQHSQKRKESVKRWEMKREGVGTEGRKRQDVGIF